MTARALKKNEIKRLKAAASMAGTRESLIVLLGMSSGLRAGEIASLNNGDIFDSRGRIRSQFSLDRKRNKNKPWTYTINQTLTRASWRVALCLCMACRRRASSPNPFHISFYPYNPKKSVPGVVLRPRHPGHRQATAAAPLRHRWGTPGAPLGHARKLRAAQQHAFFSHRFFDAFLD